MLASKLQGVWLTEGHRVRKEAEIYLKRRKAYKEIHQNTSSRYSG